MGIDAHSVQKVEGEPLSEDGGFAPSPARASSPPLRKRLFAALQARLGSSLTRRIVVLNLGGLVALFVSFLYLNQFREGLIDARVQSLQTQGQIIASAIAASAAVEDPQDAGGWEDGRAEEVRRRRRQAARGRP